MFIIKWVVTSKEQVYYKSVRSLYGASTDVYPYVCNYYVGYVNNRGHEILDIFYLYNGKFYTLEQYKNGEIFKTKKKRKIINVVKEIIKVIRG